MAIFQYNDGTAVIGQIIKILIKNGKIFPGTNAWKPIGDGITTCIYCGKLLTDEVSFARGVGPECIKKYGPMPERAWIEQHVKPYKKVARKAEKQGHPIPTMLDWMKSEGIQLCI